MQDQEEFFGTCFACEGDLVPLGKLGSLQWYRCRACGLETREEADEESTCRTR